MTKLFLQKSPKSELNGMQGGRSVPGTHFGHFLATSEGKVSSFSLSFLKKRPQNFSFRKGGGFGINAEVPTKTHSQGGFSLGGTSQTPLQPLIRSCRMLTERPSKRTS